MKKAYQKPTMRVVELQHRALLLAGSGEYPNEWDDDFAYAPGKGNGMNQLA